MLTRLRNSLARIRGKAIAPPGAKIGSNVHLGDGARLDWSHGRHITIEDDAVLVSGARVLCHDASSYRRAGMTWVAPVHIGRRAFIGADSVLMPGVTVGEDAVVAAGAVVTEDVPARAIVAGVPARVIGNVVDLDAKRREDVESGRYRAFPEPRYHLGRIGATELGELEAAVERDGGYYLVP